MITIPNIGLKYDKYAYEVTQIEYLAICKLSYPDLSDMHLFTELFQ